MLELASCGFADSAQRHSLLGLTVALLKGASSFFQGLVEASSSRMPSLVHSGQPRVYLQSGVM